MKLPLRTGTATLVTAALAPLATALALSAGCSSTATPAPAGNTPAKDSGAPPTGDDTSDAGAAAPVSLPFTVSDEFAPSGYMGDSTDDFNGIQMSPDEADCKAPRSADAAGDCYSVTWTPVLASGAPSAWVGVYWQYPSNNWGAHPGKAIAPGATKVSFYAAGKAGGESLHVDIGGVNVKGVDPTLTNKDPFTKGLDITLTTDWKRYEIPLTGATYDTVIGGFSWVAKATSTTPVTFYVDDVRWE